ncbi:hypothetical protein LT493_29225 [Streptomyces tricolor]|nr:hypothetical protein [Streptomyces tricolor]
MIGELLTPAGMERRSILLDGVTGELTTAYLFDPPTPRPLLRPPWTRCCASPRSPRNWRACAAGSPPWPASTAPGRSPRPPAASSPSSRRASTGRSRRTGRRRP